mmetsp:Transcript_114927/g.366652  ORF Transcript_114927/g.366652 Transcript_114927/m.366652 type:complete len:196 (-) Transcript_114927:16-603(-)
MPPPGTTKDTCTLVTIRRPAEPAQEAALPPRLVLPRAVRDVQEAAKFSASDVRSARSQATDPVAGSARSEQTEASVLSTFTEFAAPVLAPRLEARQRPAAAAKLQVSASAELAHHAIPTPCRCRYTVQPKFAEGSTSGGAAVAPARADSEVEDSARQVCSAARAARALAAEALGQIQACREALGAADAAAAPARA